MTTILKRLVVWLFETLCEVVLFGSVSFVAVNGTKGITTIYANEVAFYFVAIAVLFMAQSGYLLTTLIVRIFWTNRTPWLHPAISVVLFSIHLQIFFQVTHSVDPSARLTVRVAGACSVFVCTFAGGYILRTWERIGKNPGLSGSKYNLNGGQPT